MVVDRQRDRLAHIEVVERRFAGVERQISDVHPRAQRQAQARIVAQDRQLAGRRISQYVALAGQQLGEAAGAAGAQIDHHLRHARQAFPVGGVACQANILPRAVFVEQERAAADRLAVDQLLMALARQRVGVFGGQHRRVVGRQVPQERGVR